MHDAERRIGMVRSKSDSLNSSGKRLGYIRVSTAEQSPARQLDGLRAACDAVFIEKGSASSHHRPVYDEVLSQLKSGDTLVVWDVDRAYRSVIDALTEVRGLSERGIGFEAMSGEYDLSTADGGFSFTIRAAVSEWEREKLRARTREGLAAAKARGVKLGRPHKLSEQDIAAIRAKKDLGAKNIELANAYDVSSRTIARVLKLSP